MNALVDTLPPSASTPPPIDTLKNRRVTIIGAGLSGRAAAELSVRQGAKVWVYDQNPESLAKIPEELLEKLEGTFTDPDAIPDSLNLAILSPGISPTVPICTNLRHNKIPWYSELELGVTFCLRPFLAITGTNGKTTVTTMIDHVLKACGLSSQTAGNVGVPVCQLVLDGLHHGPTPIVLEVSSFQLEATYRFHPSVSVITNLAPDHLDRYDDVHDYYVAKSRIAANQTANDDLWVGPGVLDALYPVTEAAIFSFNNREHSEEGLAWNGKAVIDQRGAGTEEYTWPYGSELLPHQMENALATIGSVLSVGLSIRQALSMVETYKPPPHRVEFIKTVRGVDCYSDSKGTNVFAVCTAVDSLPGPIRLIAGGQHKGDDLKPLTQRLVGKVSGVYLVGEAAPMMAKTWEALVPVTTSGTVDQAVRDGLAEAQAGEQLLLSPACASWDQFTNYVERGKAFCDAVESVAGETSA